MLKKNSWAQTGTHINLRQIVLWNSGTRNVITHRGMTSRRALAWNCLYHWGVIGNVQSSWSGKGFKPESLVYGFYSLQTLSSQSHTEPDTVAETWLPKATLSGLWSWDLLANLAVNNVFLRYRTAKPASLKIPSPSLISSKNWAWVFLKILSDYLCLVMSWLSVASSTDPTRRQLLNTQFGPVIALPFHFLMGWPV